MKVELRDYTDDDIALTEALETDPETMAELGGPVPREEIPAIHRRRLAAVEGDNWWFVIVPDPPGPGAGTIGVWETEHEGETVHEAGWMLLGEHRGRGIASAALAALLDRARADGRFDAIHAFPGANNPPSNGLCRKFGFELIGDVEGGYRDSPGRLNHYRLDLAGEE